METIIVNFHYIRNQKNKYDGIHPIKIDEFKKIILKLKKNYNFISPIDFLENKIHFKKKNILLTFDDGLKDHYKILGILKKYKIKALFFICSKPLIGKPLDVHLIHYVRSITNPNYLFKFLSSNFPKEFKLLNKNKNKICKFYSYDNEKNALIKYFFNFSSKKEPVRKIILKLILKNKISIKKFVKQNYMNEKEIVQLSNHGHSIGLHGHSHIPLNTYNNFVKNEIEKNKKIMTKITRINNFKFFAFPYGRDYALPKNLIKFRNKYKLEYCFTMNKGINKKKIIKHNIKRINPNEISKFLK